MSHCRPVASAILALALLAGSAAGAAENPIEGDIRDVAVGMSAYDLPIEGYTGFACVSGDGTKGAPVGGWSDFKTCPPAADGLHAITFSFDEAAQQWAAVGDRWEGTKLAGHPVVLTAFIADDGTVAALRAVTDPEARAYLHKKAFLLGIRVMGRYGREGWDCTDEPPSKGRAPVGGVYLDRHCEKLFGDRRILLDTQLWRDPAADPREFTNATILEIRQAGS